MALKRRAKEVIKGLDLQKRERVLDVGCGNGYYLSLLNRLGLDLDLVGIDIDKPALVDAAIFIGDKKVKLVLSDASKIPFPNNSFDKVVMSEVIEHVNDEDKVLKEVYRVLKKNGRFCLTTCNIEYPFFWDPVNWILQHFFKTHIKEGFWAGIWNQHTRLYQRESIEKMVKKHGFKIKKSAALTSWCIPFNHYIVNLIAKIFYSHKLPANISDGLNKFKNNKQPFLIRMGFDLVNLFDKLNDLMPSTKGVSIFISAKKEA